MVSIPQQEDKMKKGLTKEEMESFKAVHSAVCHVDCFSANDVNMEAFYESKATKKQLLKVCEDCYYPQ